MNILRGNPSKRPLNDSEPQLPVAGAALDEPPDDIADNDKAAAEWRRIVPLLRRCGVVTDAERPALVALCVTWSRYLDAQQRVRLEGSIVTTRNGVPKVNPQMLVADRSLSLLHRLWVELGLTPAARARLHVPKGASGSKWADDL